MMVGNVFHLTGVEIEILRRMESRMKRYYRYFRRNRRVVYFSAKNFLFKENLLKTIRLNSIFSHSTRRGKENLLYTG